MSKEFYTTRNLFRDYVTSSISNYNAETPLSFDEWNKLPQTHKAAVLYLQFFDQIMLAYYKTRREYATDADAVSEVMQYLIKNVGKIEEDSKRFKPSYIYKITWNCLSCLFWDDPSYSIRKRTYDNERSNITTTASGEELNLYDTVKSRYSDLYDEIHDTEVKARFWELLEDADAQTLDVVARLINDHSERRRRVSEARKLEIIQELRELLDELSDEFNF